MNYLKNIENSFKISFYIITNKHFGRFLLFGEEARDFNLLVYNKTTQDPPKTKLL